MCREGRGMNLLTCYYIDLYRDTLRNLDRKQTIIVHNDYSMVSLTWSASMQIYWNKRKPLHNVAQINKVSNEFQFRHRRPKLTLRGMGDAWHLCWMRRYAPRYRWPLKTRDFVWEIKYWDLRTLNNVKSNFRSMKWMKTTYLRCIRSSHVW